MRTFKRGMAALAVAAGIAVALPAAPAAADEINSPSGVYICIDYTYIWVAGNYVPTVRSVTVTTVADDCDTAIKIV